MSDDYPVAPDYADPTRWACRPAAEIECTAGLDAISLGAAGRRERPVAPVTTPDIDCFYVYPTASREQRDYARPTPEPAVMEVIRTQAGRLASHCTLFVPWYRQATLLHLRTHPGHDWDGPYEDVLAAWNYYVTHDNGGRGVVILGHSQGALLLQRLLAERVDGARMQRALVVAFLIGDPELVTPPGRLVGGTFAHIPVCAAAAQIGCVYAWSSYLARDDAPRAFGVDRGGFEAVCTNPAHPGGEGMLDAYFGAADFAFAEGHPYAEVTGQIAGVCVRDAQGVALRISIPPGPYAQALRATLSGPEKTVPGRADWGLHRHDVDLALGNILRLIDAKSAAWKRTRS